MYLQIVEISLLLAAVGALVIIIFIISRRQPQPVEPPMRFTPGEQEILKQIDELRERLERVIPPYGRVGYVPSTLEDLKDLLGFVYIKLGNREIGTKPVPIENFEKLDINFLQANINDLYVYVIRKNEKKLIAVGKQYLDYLTVRFLYDFLDYI
ncbi:MAG: hypothetical protein QXR18_03895 [Pyrobaculum sp.]